MNITKILKNIIKKDLDPDILLPDTLPVYVSSFLYMFGVLTMASLAIIILSGIVMVIEGPLWYQYSSLGLFFRSVHFWGAQFFFFFLFIHILSVFFMAGWREGRIITWILGSLLFAISMFEAFFGFLIGGGFFAQWNQVQAKDAMNAIGLSRFINILDNSQLYGFHTIILPIVIILILSLHLYIVRKKGVVPPIEIEKTNG